MGKETPASPEALPPSSALQQNLMVAGITALLASIGTSGGLTIMSGASPADVQSEVQDLRSDVKSMKEKIDDIYEIVDKAHPRIP